MKTLLVIATVLLASFVAAQTETPPPQRFGYAVAYDLCHKSLVPVATYQVGTLHDLFKRKGFDADVIGLTGADSNGNLNVGMAIVRGFDLAREVKLKFGPWGRFDGTGLRVGVFVGIGGSL